MGGAYCIRTQFIFNRYNKVMTFLEQYISWAASGMSLCGQFQSTSNRQNQLFGEFHLIDSTRNQLFGQLIPFDRQHSKYFSKRNAYSCIKRPNGLLWNLWNWVSATISHILITWCSSVVVAISKWIFENILVIMRRASEASLFFLGFPRKKRTLHNEARPRKRSDRGRFLPLGKKASS